METLNFYGLYHLGNKISFVLKYDPCQDKLNNQPKFGSEHDIGQNTAFLETQLPVSVVTSNTNQPF